MQIRQIIFNCTDMQIMHFILDKILEILTYYMPFYRQSLQSYLISKTVRFFWPTLQLQWKINRKKELVCDLSNGATSNDLERPKLKFQGHDILQRQLTRKQKKIEQDKAVLNSGRLIGSRRVYDLTNSVIFNDLEWPQFRFQGDLNSTLSTSEMVQD